MTNDHVLSIGIIGLAHLHPRAYMPLFENSDRLRVIAVSEHSEELLRSFCSDFSLRGYVDYKKMIVEEQLDMAAIFLPHYECAEAAVQCAQHGLHMMIEKPIAHTAAAVKRVADAARANHVKITTGYCWRYHPVIRQMKECIEQGLIGDIVSVEARLAAGRVDRYVKGNSGWMLEKAKSGGGPMYNLGVHWIDTLCYLLGDKIAKVCAVNVKSNTAYDVEDSSVALLKFGSGPVGTLSTSYIVPDCFPCGRDLYLGIKGTQGVLSYAPGYEGEQASGTGQTDILELYSDSPKVAGAGARRFSFRLDKVAGYSGYMGKAYVEGFVDAIANDAEPLVTVDQAIDVLNVVEAIYRSDKKGGWETV